MSTIVYMVKEDTYVHLHWSQAQTLQFPILLPTGSILYAEETPRRTYKLTVAEGIWRGREVTLLDSTRVRQVHPLELLAMAVDG